MSKKLIYSAFGALTIIGSLGLATLNYHPVFAATSTNTEGTIELTHSLIDETVYVFANANGETKKTISSDWTKNSLGLDEYKKTEGKQETPVSLKITYTLDGEPIKAKDLAGKSGRVSIKFTYTNNKKINGYFVPYAVMTGLTLDNKHFKNIEVENGKILNDGNKTAIAGVALPGLRENLGVSKNTFNIPSDMIITADVTDFKLGMTMSLVTNELFKDIKTDHLDSLEGLESSLNKLTTGMDQLISGSSALYDGLAQLNSKTGALVSGVKELSAGATKLQAGANTIAASASELKTGAEKLNTGSITIKSGLSELSSGLSSLSGNNTALTTGAKNLTDNYSALLATIIAGLPDGPAKTQIQAQKTALDTAASGFHTKLSTYTSGVSSASSGAAKLSSGASNLVAGTNTLADGADKLSSGANTLADGATSLNNGLSSLNTQIPSLVNGINKLTDGSKDLKNGINTFNEQGIKKIVSKANGLETLAHRLKATINLSKDTNTKYVFRTDEIK